MRKNSPLEHDGLWANPSHSETRALYGDIGKGVRIHPIILSLTYTFSVGYG